MEARRQPRATQGRCVGTTGPLCSEDGRSLHRRLSWASPGGWENSPSRLDTESKDDFQPLKMCISCYLDRCELNIQLILVTAPTSCPHLIDEDPEMRRPYNVPETPEP